MKLLVMFLKNCSSIQQILGDILIKYLSTGIREVLEKPDGTVCYSVDIHLSDSFRDTQASRHLKSKILTNVPNTQCCKRKMQLSHYVFSGHSKKAEIVEGDDTEFIWSTLKSRLCLHTFTPQMSLQYLKRIALLLSHIAKSTEVGSSTG